MIHQDCKVTFGGMSEEWVVFRDDETLWEAQKME